MAHQNQLPQYHRGILCRNESTINEVPRVLLLQYTYLPEASHLLFLLIQVLRNYGCPHSGGNTRKIQPTVALCLSHVLQVFHKLDKLYLPSFQFLQAEILLFRSAHKNLLPEVSEEAALPVLELLHNPGSVQSELVLPSNAGARIPSHAVYS